jgi:hypothetical protein
MIKKYIFLYFLCALFTFEHSFAQNTSVSVSPLTGTGSVVIPLYGVSSGQVSLPVNLTYSAGGIKPNDVEGTAGMGWNVQVGGQVSRLVRGIPDDCSKDNKGHQRYGRMHDDSLHNLAHLINNFTIVNNGICSNETTDISYINAHLTDTTQDTEPDMFYVNAPGLSCTMVLDSIGKFEPTGYQDLTITYTKQDTGSNPNTITSFTITNDKGVKYVFANPESITQHSVGANPAFLANKYERFKFGITYNDAWNLTSITDINGNYIQLTYTTEPQTTGTDSVAFYLGGTGALSLQYRISNQVTPQRLSTIIVGNNVKSHYTALTLTWTTLGNYTGTGQTILSAITGSGKNYQFTYSAVRDTTTSFTRDFLRSFTDAGTGCSSPLNYQFSYIGETSTQFGYTTVLPDSTSTQRDYWGYYTNAAGGYGLLPSVYVAPHAGAYPNYVIAAAATQGTIYQYTLSNSSRTPDPTVVASGTLNKISYAMGGSTNISYELNDYYDGASLSVVKGGGIRVKQIVDSVGNGSTNNIVRNYTYVDTLTGKSSGKPISLPQYAFTLPYSGSATGQALWNAATALSAYDLSSEDHTIMYTSSRERQTGAGSTIYNYYVPACYYDTQAGPICPGCASPEWFATLDYAGRSNCSFTYGPINSFYDSYPFIPNSNYDFERGLPTKVGHYNDSGAEVSESDYTYTRSYTPSTIQAFDYETNGYGSLLVYGYSKYTLFYGTSELTATVINKTYDSPTLSVSRLDTVTYTYGSSAHKLVTQIQASNSDKSVLTSHIKYTKDYTAVSGTNPNVTAIYYLQQNNINVPVESYQQVTKNGTTSTTSASLTLFRDTTIASNIIPRASQQFRWVQPNGGSFTPMSISGQTLTKDAGYFGTANYDIYDITGLPLTVDDTRKNIGTTLVNHFSGPIAVFQNAAYNQVAYADFDGDTTITPYGFTITGSGAFTANGSHAGNAYGFGSSQTATTTSTLSKNSITQNFIFSIWINAATAGTLTLTLTGISTHPTISYTTGGWKYYEVKIPVGTLSSSYTVSFTSSQAISIDDILWYPDVAEVSTVTYQPTTHWKLDATNTNGVSVYYAYDHWGRLRFAYDQDHNIVKKNTYLLPSDVNGFNQVAIIPPANPVKGTAGAFSLSGLDSCSANGGTVTWHFGDSNTLTTSLLATASHTYSSSGKMAVTAVISSPTFGNYTLGPDSITVLSPPVVLVTYSNTTFSNGAISSAIFTPIGGPGTSYGFDSSTLNNAHIVPGKYLITITIAGGTQYVNGSGPTGSGYGDIQTNGGTTNNCGLFNSSNVYNFTIDVSAATGLTISVNQANGCI